jgi:hypothetical protein
MLVFLVQHIYCVLEENVKDDLEKFEEVGWIIDKELLKN